MDISVASVYGSKSVTAPREADDTSRAYLASTPDFAFIGGFTHRCARRSNSSSETSKLICCVSLSIVTRSPSSSSAIGPPTCADSPANKYNPASSIYAISKNFPEDFTKPITVTLAFDPASLKAGQKPVVFYYHDVKKEWVEVSGGQVSGKQISVDVSHLGTFAVFGVDPEKEVPEPRAAFYDTAGHWAEASIQQAVKDGIVKGYPDGSFKPNQTVTRAEFAVMLMNALKPQDEGVALTFTDATEIGDWAHQAITQAVQAGIIKGFADGNFRPDANITRSEMAVMIARALHLTSAEGLTGFADDSSIPAWAKNAIAAMKKQGMMQGKGSNKFFPAAPATRAEAVTVLINMLAQIKSS